MGGQRVATFSSPPLVAAAVMVVAAAAMAMAVTGAAAKTHDYGDALRKSILFFEGQRSGRLPRTQRLQWRKDSAPFDGHRQNVDLVGGYYDAGDNVKFNFPMAFSMTMLAWSLLDFGQFMGSDRPHALEALRWGTDYLLKATSIQGVVFAQVGNPYSDHSCWQRAEDMNTDRTAYAVTKRSPGSEVSGEIAAALAASALVFKAVDPGYAALLRTRASKVFQFADTYRGSYNDSLREIVCPFYCNFSGFLDELLWGALWLYRATHKSYYWNYVVNNVEKLEPTITRTAFGETFVGGSFAEFGWDAKHAGINILFSKITIKRPSYSRPFVPNADRFVCSVMPESPFRSISYSPGGLMFKTGGSNMQHATTLSFLLLSYGRYTSRANRVIRCGNAVITPSRLMRFARSQVDYILGTNPKNMSYMVGYGSKFPQKIHHRGSSLPSVVQHPAHIQCKAGSAYFASTNPNPNLLLGAVVGGPRMDDSYEDSRSNFVQSEPTLYINAPLVGVLAYFKAH